MKDDGTIPVDPEFPDKQADQEKPETERSRKEMKAAKRIEKERKKKGSLDRLRDIYSRDENSMERLLPGKRISGCLAVKPQFHRTFTLCTICLFHFLCPDSPCRPELRNFFEEIRRTVEKETEPWCEGVNVQSILDT